MTENVLSVVIVFLFTNDYLIINIFIFYLKKKCFSYLQSADVNKKQI